ncbi:hypothetical protein D9753_30390 [Streptomyces dangxiongensis]|uniref:Uncharacterized protein n=1 Tax=Streptomyces dangxiongensis TaxID=1442032 RepID=A0A3G2JJ82_9ACTN|nr:hypothetical protein [Streptomyces dangxiongensis]AYN42480.1 hypothetical protein D9753_30390 [Streptomyces dangxiongensis]
MYEDEYGTSARRRTRYTGELEELRYLGMELEECGAYVSPTRTHWLGFSGSDPLDVETDEEFNERLWHTWHDAGEVDEERPIRRRPSGRTVDIVPPVTSAVTVRVDPEIAAAYAARQAEAVLTLTYESAGGVVTVEGPEKTWRGSCAQCSKPFEQRRPASQRRRWRTLCGDVCSAEWARARLRDRMRRLRGSDGA